VYQFVGESRDTSGLMFLRARYYNNDGRFIQKDPSRSENHLYLYTEGNPVNKTDSSGLCANCYVFFFPGLGNQGNINKGGTITDAKHGGNELDDDLGEGERSLIRQLRSQTGAIVIPVYPYGAGIGGVKIDDPIPLLPPALNDSNRNLRDAVLPAADDKSSIPYTKADEIFTSLIRYGASICVAESEVEIDNNKVNVTFVGYSGGGQMAYSTAQKLRGRVFVDNLVMFGAPFRAYNGMSNIGRLWNLRGEQDTFLSGLGQYAFGWDSYNEGYREFLNFRWQQKDLNIYANGAIGCTLYGNDVDYV
jgi:RHS repeat-associated protein